MRVDGRRRNSPPVLDLVRERILSAAKEIVRGQGLSALTISAIGHAVHMRPVTIRRFVRDLDQVRDAVTATAQAELVELMEGAIGDRHGREALEALLESQRLYAQAQPGLYEAALFRPLRPGGTDARDQDVLTRFECATLQAYGATEAHAARLAWCFRAAVHGAICLEARDRQSRQRDIDENFECLLGILDAAARSTGEAVAPPPVVTVLESLSLVED